ncbi:ATP-binding protein [Streptomyces sp. NBC_01390]|uniref:DNA gyrase subunit B n=1 Tax=Streptomyces sp. NBC_01390 TaxID=2903850 RepID=UPI003250C82D
MSEEFAEYDASHIQLLEGWEAVRKRPGMYIGSSGERGLLNMVFEVADRAVNELLAGRASSVEVTLTPDGGVRVADDGPETPIDEAGGTGGPELEALLTQIQAATGPSGRHDVALSPFGVGPFVVNALSRRMTAEVRREGVRWVQEYARGVAVTELSEAGTATGSGTTIAFWPDTDIFETGEFSFDALAARFRELAFLNRALDISLIDRRRPDESRSARFRFPGGARDFVAFLDTGTAAPVLTETIAFELEDPRMAGTVEVALRWCDSHEERLRSFANSRPTAGGTHELGFRDGVVAAVNAYARERLLTDTEPGLDADRIGEGLTAVVSVKLDHPEFEGSTRGVLGNPQVRTCVGQAVQEHFGTWLEEHPEQASALVGRMQGTRRH